jgi:very-short-patch-repair endonuclease
MEGVKFRRQHPVGWWILDFYCPELHLAVEVDGSQHFLQEQSEKDEERTIKLHAIGISLLRFTNVAVLQETEAVLSVIWQEVDSRLLGRPFPSP